MAGAVVIATDASGREVGRAVANGNGYYSVALDPGTFTLTAGVSGDPMMRAPASKVVTIPVAGRAVADFVLDTGIR